MVFFQFLKVLEMRTVLNWLRTSGLVAEKMLFRSLFFLSALCICAVSQAGFATSGTIILTAELVGTVDYSVSGVGRVTIRGFAGSKSTDPADATNYTFAGTTSNYTVTPLTLAGVLGAGSSVYGASLVPGTVTFSNKVGSDIVTAATPTINTAGNTSTSGNLKAGTYTGIQSVGSTLSGADAANYTFSGATGNYTVSKATLGGSIASGTSVYGAALAPGTASITSGIVGSDQVSPGTVTVNTAGNTSTSGNLKAGTYSEIGRAHV